MSAFADRLHQARWDRNLSVRDAARQAGVSPGTWSNIENDQRSPGGHIRPLLEAWLADEPFAFPPRRVDSAIEVLERYAPALDADRLARLRALVA